MEFEIAVLREVLQSGYRYVVYQGEHELPEGMAWYSDDDLRLIDAKGAAVLGQPVMDAICDYAVGSHASAADMFELGAGSDEALAAFLTELDHQ